VAVPSVAATIIERPRLVARIADVVDHHQVALVVGPAGYGKTSALVEWAHHQDRPVAWLSVDPFDNDMTRLHRGLLASLKVATNSRHPGASKAGGAAALGRLATPGLGERLTPDFFDALLAALGELDHEIVLVLDDAHELRGRAVTEVLGTFMRELPPTVRLVISGRHDPVLPLQRLRAAGKLGEVREEDLAFDRGEVHRLVAAEPAAVDPDRAEALHRLTGGWPVAVRLMLMAMVNPDQPTPVSAVAEASTPLADYLVEEVLRGLPEDVREFVLRATCAEVLDPALADVVWDRGGGAALLDNCQRRGLFLIPEGTPTGGRTYRWHVLFAMECQAVLRVTQPTVYRAVHRALAETLGGADLPAAIGHAHAAQDDELAATLLRDRWADLLIAGEHATLRELLRQVAAPWRYGPELLVVDAAVSAVERERPAEDLLARARRLAPRLPEDRRSVVESTAALVELFIATSSADTGSAIRRGRQLLMHADELTSAGRTLAFFLVGRAEAFNAFDDQRALDHLQEGARLAAEHGFTAIELACLSESTVPLVGIGELDAAWELADEVVARARTYGWESPDLVAATLVAKGLVSYTRDHLDDARDFLEEGLRTLRPAAQAARARAAIGLMATCTAAGDQSRAAWARARALEATGASVVPFAADAVAVFGALALASGGGDIEQAIAQLEEAERRDPRPNTRVWEAEVYRCAGRHDDAVAALGRVPQSALTVPVAVGFELTAALLAADAGETEAAHQHLERALDAAAESGARRQFGERPEAASLLSDHLAWATRHESLVVELLHRPVYVHTASRGPIHWELSEREREVLLYMRSPLSAAEIASALFVSINTVKTHQRSIYRKLGVTGRHGALRAAAERGLLT
jgi:LuxR family maltose regulon positive regulatory protein